MAKKAVLTEAMRPGSNKKTPIKKEKLAELSKEELLQIIEKLAIQNNRLNQYLFGSRSERYIGDF